MKLARNCLAALLAGFVLCSCATTQEQNGDQSVNYTEIPDPLEPLNRTIFELNFLFDALLLRPIAEPYQELVPEFVRDIIRNLVRLLETPVDMANAILQGDVDAMENITARTLINLSIGFGMFDVAKDSGYPHRSEDFGQTLAVWGVEPGFYLVLPLLGPSSGRDAVGRGVDFFLDPLFYFRHLEGVRLVSRVKLGAKVIDTRARNIETIDEAQRDALDFYARVRSAWYQNRLNEIRNGEAADMPAADFSDEFLEEDEWDLEEPPDETQGMPPP